jgi:hypothetical protein
MRGRSIVLVSLFASIVGTLACNVLLGNELGHLDDAGTTADGGDAANADADDDANADGATDAGRWTPTSFGSDLALWLDGEKGVSTAFCGTARCATIWADQSGNHNDAHAQSAPSEPLIVQLAAHNGRHALRFDGSRSSLTIADSRSMEVLGGFTILAVASESAGSPHTGALFVKPAMPLPFAGPTLWLNYDNVGVDGAAGRAGTQVDYYQYVASKETRLDDGVLRVYSMTFDGVKLSLRVNDGTPVSAMVSVSSESLASPGVSAIIGGGVSSSEQVVLGDIAEIIFATRSVDGPEWASAYAYLKAKYALP